MRLGLVLYAIGFNLLFVLSRGALAPALRGNGGPVLTWLVVLLGPLALLALAMRLRTARAEHLVLVSAMSLGLVGTFAEL